MPINTSFTLPFADFFILGAIVFFAFSGFMRGALRTLFSALRIYFSFIFTSLIYERAALPFQALFDMPAWLAQMACFIAIFGIVLTAIWVVGSILIKRMANPPKTSSSLDKIGGIVLGFVEGILIVSLIIMIIDFHPTPKAHSPLENAVSYKIIKNIAPSIKDFTMRPISRLKHNSAESTSDEP